MPEKMSPEEAQRRYQRGSALFREGKYQEALAELNEVARFYRHPHVLKAQQACWGKLSAGEAPAAPVDDIFGAPGTTAAPKPEAKRRSRRALVLVGAVVGCVALTVCVYWGLPARKQQARPTPPPAVARVSPEQAFGQETVGKPPVAGASLDLELNPDDFDPNAPFDLKKEVRRVMLDPRVPDIKQPQWKRESYQGIIDAARRKRLSHGNPHLGEQVNLPPSLTDTLEDVANPFTGRRPLVMRYVSGHFPSDVTLGLVDSQAPGSADNADIIYVVGGTTTDSTIAIPSGTIVLFAAFYDAHGAGALTPSEIRSLKAAQRPGLNNVPGTTQYMVRNLPYTGPKPEMSHISAMHTLLQPNSRIIAKGDPDTPIVFCSDGKSLDDAGAEDWERVTSFDYRCVGTGNGIIDCALVTDCNYLYTALSGDASVTSRCLIDNHLESGRNGAGWVIANYFGNAYNESIDAAANGQYVVMYNIFANRCAPDQWVPGLSPISPEAFTPENVVQAQLRYNDFRNGNRVIALPGLSLHASVVFARNNLVSILNDSPALIRAPDNYWVNGGPSVKGNVSGTERSRDFPLDITKVTGKEDADGDGQPDWEEILQGTNPDDPDSR